MLAWFSPGLALRIVDDRPDFPFFGVDANRLLILVGQSEEGMKESAVEKVHENFNSKEAGVV